MKTCIYISGSPCVGKSTLAKAIQNEVPGIEYIHGDDYWRMHPGLPFEERVTVVNQRIAGTLQTADSSHVLCEWVPAQGLFVARLYEVCLLANRRFLHVILTAPESVLRKRKRERDGDEDIYSELVVIGSNQKPYRCLMYDTDKEESSRIVDDIVQWIQSNA